MQTKKGQGPAAIRVPWDCFYKLMTLPEPAGNNLDNG